VPGPVWNDDDPRDTARIAANADALVRSFAAGSSTRTQPTLPLVRSWHADLYAGCRVPSTQYVGGLRGDTDRPHLHEYEVGTGPLQPDGLPAKLGVWSTGVDTAVRQILDEVTAALAVLDARFPVGTRPSTVDDLDALISFIAAVHGEWVRVHPFANGNGRTARLWAAWLALRYGLPVFVTVKPRPDDVAYARAGSASMGRPPDFAGDHTETANVFTHLLALALLP
jgi:hypothetical protein